MTKLSSRLNLSELNASRHPIARSCQSEFQAVAEVASV